MKHYLICYGISNLLMCIWYAIVIWDVVSRRRFTWKSFWLEMPILFVIGAFVSIFIAFGILKAWMF